MMLSSDNEYSNFHKWINGEVNFLFITGFSGSGKTTLAKKLAEEYNVEYVEIDIISGDIKKRLDYPKGAVRSERWNFIMKVIMNEYHGKKVIIEGGQLIGIDSDIIKDHAIIIVGTSVIKSSYRAWLRGFKDPERLKIWIPDVGNNILKLFYYQLIQFPDRLLVNLKLYNRQKN